LIHRGLKPIENAVSEHLPETDLEMTASVAVSPGHPLNAGLLYNYFFTVSVSTEAEKSNLCEKLEVHALTIISKGRHTFKEVPPL